MHTAALLEAPEPRRMAGRPVDWMVDIIVEGGVVPVVVSMEVGRENVVAWIPGRMLEEMMLGLNDDERGWRVQEERTRQLF